MKEACGNDMLPGVVSKRIQLEKAWQYDKETVKVLPSGSKLTRSQCGEWRLLRVQ